MTNEVTQKTTSNEQNVSSSNGLEPLLRFCEFKGNLPQVKLSELFHKCTQKNRNGAINNVICNSAKNGLIPQRDFFDKDIANSENTTGYYIIKNNDFVYNPRKSNEAPYGPVSIYKDAEDGIVSPLYLCFRATAPLCAEYFEMYFKSPAWHRYVYLMGDSGARHDRVSIKDEVFFDMPVRTPSLSEQQKIADFLSLVDARIEKQRLLVESLKKYKRGLLSVIFDRKIRFKDKNANTFPEWQNTTLSDIGNFYNGLSGKNKDDFITGNSEYVTYMNVFKNTIADENICERVNVSEFEHQNIVQYGDILFTQSSETMEEVGFSSVWISSKTPFLNSFCFGLRLKKLSFVYPQFMGYLLRSYKLRILIMRESQGATRINLSSERLKNIKFMLPCFDEQVVIADLIMKIDDYIAICEEKYSYLAKLKNGLLQQMFI